MGYWLIILVAIILAVVFFKGPISSHKESDFRDNEFDDEIEDYDRVLDDDL